VNYIKLIEIIKLEIITIDSDTTTLPVGTCTLLQWSSYYKTKPFYHIYMIIHLTMIVKLSTTLLDYCIKRF